MRPGLRAIYGENKNSNITYLPTYCSVKYMRTCLVSTCITCHNMPFYSGVRLSSQLCLSLHVVMLWRQHTSSLISVCVVCVSTCKFDIHVQDQWSLWVVVINLHTMVAFLGGPDGVITWYPVKPVFGLICEPSFICVLVSMFCLSINSRVVTLLWHFIQDKVVTTSHIKAT